LYFDDIRSEKLKILEIGVKLGYSVKMWKKYFYNSKICGIDIDNLKKFEEERIHIEQGDQRDPDFLNRISGLYGPFDIVIDDGSHINEDIQKSFDCLFPLLKPGGLYIVEDLHACYWDSHGGKNPVFINTLKNIIDWVNGSGKSGIGDMRNDKAENINKMNWWEKNVEFVHLYRSIVFIKKYSAETKLAGLSRKTAKIISQYLHPKLMLRKIKTTIKKYAVLVKK
jgi:demethylmacrocin O-methyltransferase